MDRDRKTPLGFGRGSITKFKPTKPRSVAQAEQRYGVSSELFKNYFSLDRPVSLTVQKSLTGGMGLDQPVEEKPEVVKVNEKLGTEYVKEVLDNEKKHFERDRFGPKKQPPNTNQSHSVTMDEPMDLDGVSTTAGDAAISPPDDSVSGLYDRYFSGGFGRSSESSSLPIAKFEKKILQRIQNNRVTLITGATGCGKTTQVPQFILDDHFNKRKPVNIVVTQPRKIAAISIAKRVCADRRLHLGYLVGYQVGLDKQHVHEDTRLLYMTTGVLLQKLIHTKKIDNYTHIIIDEIHERSIETDLLLMVIRKLMVNFSSPIKLILMSATFDTEQIINYFTLPSPSTRKVDIAPSVVNVSEATNKKISTFYMDDIQNLLERPVPLMDFDNPGITQETFDVACQLVLKLDSIEKDSPDRYGKKGAVLIFVPGYEEITELVNFFETQVGHRQKSLLVLPLHSCITIEEQNRVFDIPQRNERKIIIATNIAESSITVPDVEYIIDFCLTRNLIVDRDTHYPVLRLEWASQANCEQRAGRTGRVCDGRAYRLVFSNFYQIQMRKYPLPELIRSPLELSCLKVKMLELGPPKDLLGLCLDPPNLSDIRRAILQLKHVGALTVLYDNHYDIENGDITPIGIIMSSLPLDVKLSKFLIFGHIFGCLEDCIIIAACLSLNNLFSRPYNEHLQAYKARLAWSERSFSDLIAYLNAFKMYKTFEESGFFKNQNSAKVWCNANYLQYRRVKEADALCQEIKKRLGDNGIQIPSRPNQPEDWQEELILKVVMCGAFFPNYFLRMDMIPEEIDKILHNKDPFSSVKISNLPANQGVLYTNNIRKLFKDCSDQMDIDFEETHAIITFSSDKHPLEEAKKQQNFNIPETCIKNSKKADDHRDTAVKTAVYLAIKKRLHGIDLSIPILRPEYAEEALEKYKKERDQKLAKLKYLRTNKFSVPAIPKNNMQQVVLPMTCQRFDVIVTVVIDCGHFWVQYRNDQTAMILDSLRDCISELTAYAESGIKSPKSGDIVLAERIDEDGNAEYCRARVELLEKKVRLFFIDYGESRFESLESSAQWIDIDNFELPTDILKTPALAMECKLSEIKPSPIRCMNDIWTNDAKDYFKKLVFNRRVEIEPYSIVNNLIRARLYIRNEHNRPICVNDDLIQEGFGEYSEESLASKLENSLRQTRSSSCTRYPSLSSSNSVDTLISHEPDYTGTKKVFLTEKHRLRGPISPLEVSYQGITKLNYHLKINIDQNSVNCVALESSPTSSHSRLLVSAQLNLSGGSGKVSARDTSLMPNIRGFPSLMCLLFAPACEFRVDYEKTRYIGALCGLGFDPDSKQAYDKESDIEIPFDVAITPKDIGAINMTRLFISEMLSTVETLREYVGNSLVIRQQQMRQKIKKLLDCNRIAVEPKTFKDLFKWGLLPEDEISYFNPQAESIINPNQNSQLLTLHKTIDSIRSDSWINAVKSNMEDIRNLIINRLNHPSTCILCDMKFYVPSDLSNHLKSDLHDRRQQDLLGTSSKDQIKMIEMDG